MKKFLCTVLFVLLALSAVSCDSGENISTPEENSDEQVSTEASAETEVNPMDRADKVISSTDYTNTGKMGDADGPAFAVYSNIGYSGASAVLDIKDMNIKTLMDDGKFLNGYAFLGIDVYEGSHWINCVDVGLCWSGVSGGWHIFYNMYQPLNEGDSTWYESSKKLPKNGVYTISLQMTDDNKALFTVESQTSAFSDTVEVNVKGAKKDGSNLAFLFNVALDFPNDTKVDKDGKPSSDWSVITDANTDKGVYLKDLHAADLTLYKGENAEAWTNDKNSAVSIWPDKKLGFDYAPTQVYTFDGTEYYINLDMNRK